MSDAVLETVSPEELGLSGSRWQVLLANVEKLCRDRSLTALALQVQRRGLTTVPLAFGSRTLDGSSPLAPENGFLVASLTKPVMAMATLLLVERGQLSLNQRVVDLLPKFCDAPKRPTTVRHLLTHTSGLPDMLPNNQELRKAQASLARFVDETCQADLGFPPGRGVQYQSMGFALLGPIVEQIAGMDYRKFVRREIFQPLGMKHTRLGLFEESGEHISLAEVDVPDSQKGGTDWNWNSRYWRQLGAPWGGMVSTASDLSRFCRAMLDGGRLAGGERLFSPQTIQLATTNRLGDFPAISEADRRTRGWGCGWRMNWKDHRGTFGDLVPDQAIGHWGATGTLFWIEPEQEIAVVLLSTTPLSDDTSPLVRISNQIAAAFIAD